MSHRELSAAAESALTECMDRFPLRVRPRVEWRPYRVTAGMAYFRTSVIGLSPTVLTSPEAVRTTVIHEYAHLLAYAREGRKAMGHGVAWRKAMEDLGQAPLVHHHYPVQRNAKLQQVEYQCLGCGTILVRCRRLPSRRRYLHVTCGGDLKLIRVTRITADSRVA